MKKRLLCLLLAFIMCFPTVTAYASEVVMDIDSGEFGEELETYTVTTGEDDELDTVKSYEIYIPVDTKKVVLPITFNEKGLFYCAAELAEEMSSVYLNLYIYSDEECTKRVSYSTYDYKAAIPKSGTYYIELSINDYSGNPPAEYYNVLFASQFFKGNDKTLKNKQWAVTGNVDTSKPVYYKVTVSKAGVLTINTEAEYSSYVTLLDSKKKDLSEDVYAYSGNEYKAVFAVKKGTYYIKVKSSSDILRIKYTFTSPEDKSGASKSKATKMTAGKEYTGMITASDKKGTTDWYKITLTKSQKVEFEITGNVSSGNIKLEFYGDNISGTITRNIDTLNEDAGFKAETWTSDKLPKGTYYIKFTKDKDKTSGYYKIKLLKNK